MSIKTKPELIEALNFLSTAKEIKNTKEYWYILCARKSTDEKGKQIMSLPDQIRDCKEYAEKNDIKIVRIMQEAVSAKEAGTRPKFREMINLFGSGKYDGILAWHPDRLARNMRDAGEIIDLVDKGTIKDLKFPTFNFDNSAGGKMHLGITFVLSKHYSDHLRESVERGNRNRIAEGKYINRPKYGYIKDSNQHLLQDTKNDNFNLIRNAFKMRVEGKTLEEIGKYLNENNLTVTTTKSEGVVRHAYKMTKQRVSRIMSDLIYIGILQYGKNEAVNLFEKYGFVPMLSVEDFLKVNKMGKNEKVIRLVRKYHRAESVKASLMRDMVICSYCGKSMTAGITPKKTKDGTTNYYYLRCDTLSCERKGKSVRAIVFIDYLCHYLEQKPFSSQKSYEHYAEEMKRVSGQRLADAQRNLRSLQSQKLAQEEKIESIKEILSSNEDDTVKQLYREDLKPTQNKMKEIEEKMEQTKEFIQAGKVSILTYAEFIELMEKMPQIIRKMNNLNDMDIIIRKIFLNFFTDGKNVTKLTLNSPFDRLETVKVSDCAGGET